MNPIPVPKPSPKEMNPNRPANALLLAQIQHLQHAERRLPLRYRSEIYTHAIRTEGEAAAYIREVTEAIHRAHGDSEVRRTKLRGSLRGLEIAAAAERLSRKPSPTAKKKSGATKRGKKK